MKNKPFKSGRRVRAVGGVVGFSAKGNGREEFPEMWEVMDMVAAGTMTPAEAAKKIKEMQDRQ